MPDPCTCFRPNRLAPGYADGDVPLVVLDPNDQLVNPGWISPDGFVHWSPIAYTHHMRARGITDGQGAIMPGYTRVPKDYEQGFKAARTLYRTGWASFSSRWGQSHIFASRPLSAPQHARLLFLCGLPALQALTQQRRSRLLTHRLNRAAGWVRVDGRWVDPSLGF